MGLLILHYFLQGPDTGDPTFFPCVRATLRIHRTLVRKTLEYPCIDMLFLLDCVSSEPHHAYKLRRLLSVQQHKLWEPRRISGMEKLPPTHNSISWKSCNHAGEANMASQHRRLGDVLING